MCFMPNTAVDIAWQVWQILFRQLFSEQIAVPIFVTIPYIGTASPQKYTQFDMICYAM